MPRAATRCRCCRVVPAQGSSAAQGSGHGRAGRLETEGPRPSSRGHRGRNQDSDAPRLQTPDGPAACVLAGPSTTFQRAECNVRDEVAASLRPAGHRRSLRRSQQRRVCRRGAGWGQARDGGAGGGWACAAGTPPPPPPFQSRLGKTEPAKKRGAFPSASRPANQGEEAGLRQSPGQDQRPGIARCPGGSLQLGRRRAQGAGLKYYTTFGGRGAPSPTPVVPG